MKNRTFKIDCFEELSKDEMKSIDAGGWFKYGIGFIYESAGIAFEKWSEYTSSLPPSTLYPY
ncbi:MAG: hypothetical protein ACRCY5_05030 [Phocaeicola sp.]